MTKINSGAKSRVSYFWNYNTCNKGPRKKPCIDSLAECSHTSTFNYEDPIKDSETMSRLRKSEASTTVPNLKNFVKIRNNIEKLSSHYKDTVQRNGRISPKSRNILASKICRLKKKAYHESLKIKYAALGIEHEEIRGMIRYLHQLRQTSVLVGANDLLNVATDMLIVKASGRLDEFITDLLHFIDSGDHTNPVILKLTNKSKPETDMLLEVESDANFEGSENTSFHFDELDFLLNDTSFNDFLNSSGSTLHTDDSSCLQ